MAEDSDVRTEEGAHVERFARLALGCVAREFPHKADHVVEDETQAKPHRRLHPAFYGCFDWHSAVHGHWLLAHLLRKGHGGAWESEARAKLAANLTRANLEAEAEYFRSPERKSFERPYGWAWLLKLHEEFFLWDDADAEQWFDSLKPLAAAVVAKYLDFFPRQQYPIRTGTHFNTAFGLAFAHDYATTLTNVSDGGPKTPDAERARALHQLKTLVEERARTYFESDTDCPARWEPAGDEFLSPCLVVADLMRRVLAPEEFARWFANFLPGVAEGKPASLLTPAGVSDRSDPKIVHLDGLNLSRAWSMRNVARALPREDPARAALLASARLHADATLPHVTSGDYAGEHWLATFAVLMLSAPAAP